MIGEKIPESDEHWCNFLRLLCIMDYVFAPVVSTDCIEHLKELIQEHHEAFTELYPSSRIIPKMHYLIHYPECIERYLQEFKGDPLYLQCMHVL